MHKHRGAVSIKLDKTYPIKYDWDALAQLRDLLGEDYSAKVLQAVSTEDVKTLAQIIAIGSGGALKAEKVMKASPPLHIVVEAIREGINVAYSGEPNPPNPLEAGAMKRFTNLLMSWLPRKKPRLQEA